MQDPRTTAAVAEISDIYAIGNDSLLRSDAISIAADAGRMAVYWETQLEEARGLHDESNYVGSHEQRVIAAYREAEAAWTAAAAS